MTKDNKKIEGLDLLRVPFSENQISKLPKPTKMQTDEVRADFKKGIRCEVCGGWHHPKVIHLDYVGHAALTDRLLDADPKWNWEPVSYTSEGTPRIDANGGMWIKLTVCGITRLGYGHADGKQGGDAIKEVIGDSLRNAAMRFGAALDLWHKGDLHATQSDENQAQTTGGQKPTLAELSLQDRYNGFLNVITQVETLENLEKAVSKGAKLTAEVANKDKEHHEKLIALIEKRREELTTQTGE